MLIKYLHKVATGGWEKRPRTKFLTSTEFVMGFEPIIPKDVWGEIRL